MIKKKTPISATRTAVTILPGSVENCHACTYSPLSDEPCEQFNCGTNMETKANSYNINAKWKESATAGPVCRSFNNNNNYQG